METPMHHPIENFDAPADRDAAYLADFDGSPAAALSLPDTGAREPDGPTDPLQAVFDVPVQVRAVLGRARMPIGELLRLKAGMVIELDRRVGEPVDIYVNDRLIARGEVVLIDDALGVTLTEIVQADR